MSLSVIHAKIKKKRQAKMHTGHAKKYIRRAKQNKRAEINKNTKRANTRT